MDDVERQRRLANMLDERATCIGGSDTNHLIGMAPYGCRRRLWYDKAGVKADFPFTGNAATERGIACETFAAEDFQKNHPEYQLAVESVPPFRTMVGFAHAGCHADRLVFDTDQKRTGPIGVLEIKCPSARVYYAGRGATEPPNEARLQAVWNAGIWQADQAWVQWFSTDAWRSRVWHVPSNRAMFNELLTLAIAFWHTLKDPTPPYDPLPDGDCRCNSCPWRATCKGLGAAPDYGELDETVGKEELRLDVDPAQLDRLVLGYLHTKKMKSDAEAAHDIVKAELVSLIPRPGYVTTGVGKITFSRYERAGYTVKPTVIEQLRVKPLSQETTDGGIDTE